jgi:hypothetical protein
MTDKERKRREQEVTNGAHSVCLICKKRQEPKHLKESLAVFGAHFSDEKGEPVKSSTMSDVLKGGAAAPHTTYPCFRYTKSMSLSPVHPLK